jgi:tritrans,polycis-undecaprenyl-diphosphate synthase [geranylgeranyl-diphosphate specific]
MDNVLTNTEHVVNKFSIKVRFIGRTHLLPKHLQKKLHLVEEKTKNNMKQNLNVAVAYGGQQEIVDATKKILEKGLKGIIKPSDLNENVIKSHLWTNGQPAPDLILRTGGENRLSNFLPFQSVYAELFFLKKKWPEINKKDFMNVIQDFSKRQRRFGS